MNALHMIDSVATLEATNLAGVKLIVGNAGMDPLRIVDKWESDNGAEPSFPTLLASYNAHQVLTAFPDNAFLSSMIAHLGGDDAFITGADGRPLSLDGGKTAQLRLSTKIAERYAEWIASHLVGWDGLYLDEATRAVPFRRSGYILDKGAPLPDWADWNEAAFQKDWLEFVHHLIGDLASRDVTIIANSAGWAHHLFDGITLEHYHVPEGLAAFPRQQEWTERFTGESALNVLWDSERQGKILRGRIIGRV